MISIGVALYLGWILALIVLATIPLIGFGWYKNVFYRRLIRKQEQVMYKQSDKRVEQIYSVIKLVKQMNAENFQLELYKKNLQELRDKYFGFAVYYGWGLFLALITLYGGITLSFWYGGQCVLDTAVCPQSISWRKYTAGSIVKIIYGMLIPALSLNQLTPALQKIAEGK